MKTKSTMRKHLFFNWYDSGAVCEYLEDMAKKGWRLTKVSQSLGLICKFEKAEPMDTKFSVEWFKKASMFDTRPSRKTQEYIDYCTAAGWEFVCNIGHMVIFKTDRQDAPPVETDPVEKLKSVGATMFWQFMILILLVPLYVYKGYHSMFHDFPDFITSNMALLLVPVAILILIFSFGSIVLNGAIWFAKNKRRIKKGLPMQHRSIRQWKRAARWRFSPLLMMLALLIALAAYERSPFPLFILFIALMEFAGIAALMSVLYQPKLGRGMNIVITVAGGVVLALIITAGIFGIAESGIFSDYLSNRQTSVVVVDGTEYAAKWEERSFFASKSEYIDINGKTEGTTYLNEDEVSAGSLLGDPHTDVWANTFHIEIYRSNFNVILEQIARSPYLGDESVAIDVPDVWGAKAAYRKKYDVYLLYDGYVLAVPAYDFSGKIDTTNGVLYCTVHPDTIALMRALGEAKP